jgi:hypothetical protein
MRRKEISEEKLALQARFGDVGGILRGSLLERTTHHSKGCSKCRNGGGHLLWVLSVTYPGGKNRQISLRPEEVASVREALLRYREVKETLEAICELNQQSFLLDREEHKGVPA